MTDYKQLKLENQLCFPLYACAKEIVRRYTPFLDPLGLTYTQYITMMVLWEQKETSVKEIGKILYLDSGTLTPMLKKLEAKGYITRRRSKEDERSVLISLTKEGEALKAQAASIPAEVGACLNIAPEDAEILYRTLYRILGSLTEEAEDGSQP